MKKSDEKKKIKEETLLKSAFNLFTKKGVKETSIQDIADLKYSDDDSIYSIFMNGIKQNNIKLKCPEATLFMIIELASSTCFNSIINRQPLKIDLYKPYLFDAIKLLLKEK